MKLRRNTEIQINMQIKLTCCCRCYSFFRSAKHGKPPKAVLRREPFLWEGVVRDGCILTIQNARNTCPSPHFPMNYVTHFFLIVSLPAVIRKGWSMGSQVCHPLRVTYSALNHGKNGSKNIFLCALNKTRTRVNDATKQMT